MNGWKTEQPPVNHVVEVWYYNAIILAVWDGKRWKTVDGALIDGISHWREK